MTQRAAMLLVLASAFGWSTAGLFVRAIPADIATVTFWRGLFGAGGLVALIVVMQGPQGLRDFGRLGRAGLAYATAATVGMLTFIGALKSTSVAHVSIIYATVPFAAAFAGWLFLRERPSGGAIAAAAVALAGAVVMVGLGGDGTVTGDLMAVVMVLAAAAMILIARANPGMPTLAAAALSAVVAPALCLPFATLSGLGTQTLALLAAFGLVNTTMALALFIIGSRRLTPVTTALVSALETPMTPLWVWLAFAETPAPATLIGGAIVLAAVVWYLSRAPAA